MSFVAKTFVNLIAWFAAQAVTGIGRNAMPFAIAVPGAAALGQTVGPNRAGRLVPVQDDTLEPEFGRSLVAHWALWAAVALILLILLAGYLRRRWRAAAPSSARLHVPLSGRDRPGK